MSDTKRKPVNTAAQDPTFHLLNAAVRGPRESIYAQEAEGQRSFVGSDTLPTTFNFCAQKDFEALGVKFLGPVEGDPLFQYVELPKGWTKRPTYHSMWSELFDADGKKVASIFYKAAFYDRNAHIILERQR